MGPFAPLRVPRTTVATTNPILYDNGRAVNGFFRRSTAFFGRQVLPPDNKQADGTASFMAPPSHYHLLQTETFVVESGEGIWYVGDRKGVHLKVDETTTIPRFVAHRFENVPGCTEPLSVLYRYEAQMYEMERQFFCNMLTYLDDCRKAGVRSSVPQLAIFAMDAWLPLEVIWVPGGELLFGYKGTYAEYHTTEDKLPEAYYARMEAEKDK